MIAADCVYYPEVAPCLARVLRLLLRAARDQDAPPPELWLANAVRNPDTWDLCLEALRLEGLTADADAAPAALAQIEKRGMFDTRFATPQQWADEIKPQVAARALQLIRLRETATESEAQADA